MIGVSRQSYYRKYWDIEAKQHKTKAVLSIIEPIRQRLPRLGGKKLYYLCQDELNAMGIGRDKLFSILRANGLLISPKRSYRKTTNSHHRFRKHKNLIVDMPITRPEQLWVADITYIGGRNKNCYLSLVTDAYSKKIMGFDVSNSLATEGTLRALRMADRNRMYRNEELIHHSDRGLQYCSDAYQRVLQQKKIKCSMTETYDPYANAVAERVNGILKQEFLLEEYDVDIKTMKQLVAQAVEFYNELRPHYSSHMLTPKQAHLQREVEIRTYKKVSDRENPNAYSKNLDYFCPINL